MSDFLKIIPFVIGAAVSPILLVTTLFILSSKKNPKAKSLTFLLAGTITISIVTIFIILTSSSAPARSGGSAKIPHIIIGLLLLFLAFDIYKKGPQKSKQKNVKSEGLLMYFLLGAVMMLTNFTTIAMIFEVALMIRELSIGSQARDFYILLTIISSLIPILLPLIVLIIPGKEGDKILKNLSSFMGRYSYIVTSIFFTIIALYILTKAFI